MKTSMDSFRILVNETLFSRIEEPLIILAAVAVAILAVTAVFVRKELKKNGRDNKDA